MTERKNGEQQHESVRRPRRAPITTTDNLRKQVQSKEQRKLHARRSKKEGLWFGLGTFGVVGWSVVIPTLLGLALGVWIDSGTDGRFSWTLMLLLGGLLVGCLNAWYWLTSHRNPPDDEGDHNKHE
jgi:ATP synthase protein I